MTNNSMPRLVDTSWLAEHLGAPDLSIIDATSYMPNENLDASKQFQEDHIPGAVFLDIEHFSDQNTHLPHMLPDPEKFSKDVTDLGIKNQDHIIVYDRKGLFSAARIWWTFRVMGHDRISILNGGLPKWIRENRPLTSGKPSARSTPPFQVSFRADMVRHFSDLLDVVNSKQKDKPQILDARPAARFTGEAAEPRPGLKSGHMPGALNIPYSQLLNPDGTLKTQAELTEVFLKAGVDLDKQIITSCGSGITAAVLSFGLALIGHDNNTLYDGSWAEWGSREGAVIVTDATS